MFPDEFTRGRYERELRRATEYRIFNLGRWPLEAIPAEVLEFRNLIGLGLGASDLEMQDGKIARDSRTLYDADEYRMDRPFRDLALITQFTELEAVDLSCCRAITDLAPLKELSRLKALYLYGNTQLTDLSVLTSLTLLEDLDVSETGLSDFSLLASLPRLRKLTFFSSKNADLKTLAALPHLEDLIIFDDTNSFGPPNWKDLGFLSGLTNLKRLRLAKLRGVSDWSPIASLPQLRHLKIIESTGLKSFSPLKPLLPQLESLYVREKLSDLPIKYQSEEDDSCNLVDGLESIRKYFAAGKKKPRTPSDVPDVPDSLFDDLRKAIGEAVRSRLKSGELPTTDGGLYALTVFVHISYQSWVTLYHHTLEGLAEFADPELHYKWSPADWGTFESIANEQIEAIVTAYSLDKLNSTGQEKSFEAMRTRAPATAILALRDLDREGVLGPSTDRDKLTLLSGNIDDEEVPEELSLTAAVTFLNSLETANRFLNDWAQIEDHPSGWVKKMMAKAAKSDLGKYLATVSPET